MSPWRSLPSVRLLFPFAGGVICARTVPDCLPGWIPGVYMGCLLILCISLVLFQIRSVSFRYHWVPGLCIWSSLILLGTGTGILLRERKFTVQPQEEIIVRIIEHPRHTGERTKLIGRVFKPDTGSHSLYAREKVLLSLPRDSSSMCLRFGDWILASASFRQIEGASGPDRFDAAAFYGLKGVFSQGWVDETRWRPTEVTCERSVQVLAFRTRDRLLEILRRHLPDREEFAVASAILLGYMGGIDTALRKGYAASGAMHILSVSGMHVGVIYLFLDSLLGFLGRRRYGSLVKAPLMIMMIWVYSFITGLSPPVFRAALMLSLLILGTLARRKPESLNVVATSMLIMLLVDPMLLFNLGFQFSYLAVTGILLFYQPIFIMIRPPGWILSRLWGMVAVSIAAQISTFPLALYAFHQFPNYFLLTNILVLPLTSLAIYIGIGVLTFSSIPCIAYLLAYGLRFAVGFLNDAVFFVEGLPGSVTQGIYPSLTDTLLLYFGIISAAAFLLSRKSGWFLSLLIVLLAASMIWFARDYS